MTASPIHPGFMALHSHRAENLLETVVAWLQAHLLGSHVQWMPSQVLETGAAPYGNCRATCTTARTVRMHRAGSWSK